MIYYIIYFGGLILAVIWYMINKSASEEKGDVGDVNADLALAIILILTVPVIFAIFYNLICF